MTTTILHVSDTHLGYRQYRSRQRRDDFVAAFDQAVDIALGEHPEYDTDPVDAVIHTGDLFDDTDPSIDDVYDCHEVLQRLSDADIPFYTIVGNHERKMNTQFVDLYERSEVATRLDKTPTPVNDEVALYGIDAVRSRSWETTDFSLTPPEFGDDDVYQIVCMHQLFAPPIEDEFVAEYELEPVIDRFDIDIDALALGDYHEWTSATVKGVEAFYPGSTERCAKSESAPRAVNLMTIEPEADSPLSRRRLTLDTRDFVQIEIEFGRGDNINTVEQKLDEYDSLEDKVVIVELDGADVPVTNRQIHDRLQSRNVTVSKVDDNRTLSEFDDADLPDSTEVQDIESAIDDALEDEEFTEVARGIEDIVRDDSDIAKSNIEDEVESLLEAARTDEFEDADDATDSTEETA